MKKIMNEWRNYLSESKQHFGEVFEKFKSEAEKGKNPLWLAYGMNFKKVGEGSTRVVFSLPGNDHYVLKIINTDEISKTPGEDPNKEGIIDRHGFTIQNKRNANMYESDISLQLQYPSLFPRSTEHADDYSWLLIENVDPLTQQEFRAELGLPETMTSMGIRALVEMILASWQNKGDSTHFSHKYVAESANTFNLDDFDIADGDTDITTSFIDKAADEPSSFDYDATLPMSDDLRVDAPKDDMTTKTRENIKSILRNTQAVRILTLMAKHKIQASEFKASNLGYSKLNGNKLVMLDISLWDDK